MNEHEAATTLGALSAAGTLTELDAARVLAGAPAGSPHPVVPAVTPASELQTA